MKMTANLPDIAPSKEFNDLENEANSTLKQVLDEVKQLSDWDEGQNDNINISNFLGANFENNLKDNITPGQADTIIKQLDKILEHQNLYAQDVIQEINDLRSLLQPIANPVVGTDRMVESEADVSRSFNLHEYRRDVNSINSSIEEYIGKIDGNKGYENLVVNLKEIKKVMLNPTFKNFDKLHNFLQSNNVMGDWDGDNPAPIIEGVQKFLSKVGESMNTIINEGTVINNYETIANQEKAERAEFQKSFEEFANRLKPDQMYRLSKLKDNDIDNINKFIDDKGNSDKVLSTYFTMLENQGHLKDRGDIKVFNKIKEKIETTYNQESRGERELDNKTNVDGLFKLWIQNTIDWNGDNIENTDPNMEKRSKGHQYSADQLMDRFNVENGKRKEKNESLMQSIDDVTELGDLANVKKIMGEDGTVKLEVTIDGQAQELTAENFRSKLGLTITPPDGCKFVGDEFNQTIKKFEQHRFDEISAKIPDPEPQPAQAEDSEQQTQLESLESKDDIKVNLFKINADDIIGTISSAKDLISDENKDALTGKINDVINALRVPGKAVNGSGSESIQKLQKTIQETLKLNPKINPDGKLGKNTLFAIREYLGVASRGDKLRYETNRGSLGNTLNGALQGFDDLNTLTKIIIDDNEDLGALQDKAEDYIRNPLKFVVDKLSENNCQIAGKKRILDTINKGNGDNMRVLQLSLLPNYKGTIDGKMGPLTTRALQDYIEKNISGNENDITPLMNGNNDKMRLKWDSDQDTSYVVDRVDGDDNKGTYYGFDGTVIKDWEKNTLGENTYVEGTVNGKSYRYSRNEGHSLQVKNAESGYDNIALTDGADANGINYNNMLDGFALIYNNSYVD